MLTRQAAGRRPLSEKSYLAAVWARLRRDRMAILSIVVLALITALSLLARDGTAGHRGIFQA